MNCTVKNNSSMDMGPLLPLLKSLLPYSRKKLGFNRPPSLFFASDTENASKPLGKTAFYDPEGVSITIFVDGRHPKDILRSISHELVHHMQHERGDFGTDMATGEGYAQKNDALRELEREAYESGNMCFRDWEDENKHALQEAKQHFYRKNKKMSANDKRNDKIESLLMEKWGFKAKVSDSGLIQEEKKNKLLEWQLPDMIPGEGGLHSIYPDFFPGGGKGGILGAPETEETEETEHGDAPMWFPHDAEIDPMLASGGPSTTVQPDRDPDRDESEVEQAMGLEALGLLDQYPAAQEALEKHRSEESEVEQAMGLEAIGLLDQYPAAQEALEKRRSKEAAVVAAEEAAYLDTLIGTVGAMDQQALADMGQEGREKVGRGLGQNFDISVSVDDSVHMKQIDDLLKREDVFSREPAIIAISRGGSGPISKALNIIAAEGIKVPDGEEGEKMIEANREWLMNARDAKTGEFILKDLATFKILTLPEENPERIALLGQLNGAQVESQKGATTFVTGIMEKVYRVGVDGRPLEKRRDDSFFNNLFFSGNQSKRVQEQSALMKRIEKMQDRGTACNDMTDPNEEGLCGDGESAVTYQMEKHSKPLVDAMAEEQNDPSFDPGRLRRFSGSTPMQGTLPRGIMTNLRSTKDPDRVAPVPRNMDPRLAAALGWNDEQLDGAMAEQLAYDMAETQIDFEKALYAFRKEEIERRVTAELNKGAADTGVLRNRIAKNVNGEFTLQQLISAHNQSVMNQVENGGGQGRVGGAIVSEADFALDISRRVKEGYRLSRHGVVSVKGAKVTSFGVGKTLDEVLSSDWGIKNLLPDDFSAGSQEWFNHVQESFSAMVKPGDKESLKKWMNRMQVDRTNGISYRGSGRRIQMIPNRDKSGKSREGKFSNRMVRERSRKHHVTQAINSILKPTFSAQTDKIQVAPEKNSPSGRREDNIREALIRKVVQKALKRKFGE